MTPWSTTNPQCVTCARQLLKYVGRNFGTSDINWPGKNPDDKIYFEGMLGSASLLETLGMKLIRGRGVNKQDEFNDEIIVNEL